MASYATAQAGHKIEMEAPEQTQEPVRKTDLKEREGFLKMLTLGIAANLYNGSPGRDPHQVARFACQAAEAVWDEWVKRGQ